MVHSIELMVVDVVELVVEVVAAVEIVARCFARARFH